VCGSAGRAVLGACRVVVEPRADRLVVAAWLGALLCGSALLMTSLTMPLGVGSVAGVLGAITLGALVRADVRADWKSVAGAARTRAGWGWAAGLGALAAVFSRRVEYFDSGAYHVGVIEWLTSYGTVPGVSLVHSRLGFGSTWFGLAAVFNDAASTHG